MIYSLGGQIDLNHINSTHYIISKNKFNNFLNNKMKSHIFKTKNIYIINIKWLIDTYFFLTKMDEEAYKNIDF